MTTTTTADREAVVWMMVVLIVVQMVLLGGTAIAAGAVVVGEGRRNLEAERRGELQGVFGREHRTDKGVRFGREANVAARLCRVCQ